MKQKSIFIITILLLSQSLFAQQDSISVESNKWRFKPLLKKSILPLSLITVGSILSCGQFEKDVKHDIRSNIIEDFALPIDDQMQYVPIAELYIADILGVEAKNHWFDQTKYLIISNIITASFTHAGKRIINKQRPNGADHAFPSGHTSFSFTNATVLYEEFNETAPVLAYSGFVLTTTVAGLRVINNKHWVSDVVVGAGLGIVVTRLVYHFEPLKDWNPFKKTENITFVPGISNSGMSVYVAYRF